MVNLINTLFNITLNYDTISIFKTWHCLWSVVNPDRTNNDGISMVSSIVFFLKKKLVWQESCMFLHLLCYNYHFQMRVDETLSAVHIFTTRGLPSVFHLHAFCRHAAWDDVPVWHVIITLFHEGEERSKIPKGNKVKQINNHQPIQKLEENTEVISKSQSLVHI